MLIAPCALAVYLACQQEEASECEASRADLIRGSYENKIRFFASPEKVFEVFAGEEDSEGQTQMSYADFLRCLTPYNNMELLELKQIEEYLKEHTPQILKYADSDGDGQISYTEFVFFLMLYQCPEGVIHRIFKKYGGKLTSEEFSNEMLKQRKSIQAKSVKKQQVDGRKIKATDEEFFETNKRITANLFNGKKHIQESELIQFKQQMTEDLWNYEFFTYEPNEQNEIDLDSWLMSIIVCMHGSKVNEVKKRIKKVKKSMPEGASVNY